MQGDVQPGPPELVADARISYNVAELHASFSQRKGRFGRARFTRLSGQSCKLEMLRPHSPGHLARHDGGKTVGVVVQLRLHRGQ